MRFLSVLALLCSVSLSLLGQTAKGPAKIPKSKPAATLPIECALVLEITKAEATKFDQQVRLHLWSKLQECVAIHGNMMTKAELRKAFNVSNDLLVMHSVTSLAEAYNEQQELVDKYNGLVKEYNGLGKQYSGLLELSRGLVDSNMRLNAALDAASSSYRQPPQMSAWRRALLGIGTLVTVANRCAATVHDAQLGELAASPTGQMGVQHFRAGRL